MSKGTVSVVGLGSQPGAGERSAWRWRQTVGDHRHHADMQIKVEPQGGGSMVQLAWRQRDGPSTLELHVPKGASLDIGVVSAPLVVDGIDGGSIVVNTVSGRARINARTPSLKVESVSGGIELAGHAEQADLQTVSGDILAPILGSEVKLQTISGRIQARRWPVAKADAQHGVRQVQLAASWRPTATSASTA
jgi:hypothetical protein